MTPAALLLQDAAAMAQAVRSGAVSAVALVQASLERIAATDARVNAFTFKTSQNGHLRCTPTGRAG